MRLLRTKEEINMTPNTTLSNASPCKYCYGKGYSSRMYHEIGSPDFPGDKGWKELKEERVLCKCQNEQEEEVSEASYGAEPRQSLNLLN